MDQGVAGACHCDGFHDLGPFDKAPGTVQSPELCASAPSRPPSGTCNIARQFWEAVRFSFLMREQQHHCISLAFWVGLFGFMRFWISRSIACKICSLHMCVFSPQTKLYSLRSASVYVDMCNIFLNVFMSWSWDWDVPWACLGSSYMDQSAILCAGVDLRSGLQRVGRIFCSALR